MGQSWYSEDPPVVDKGGKQALHNRAPAILVEEMRPSLDIGNNQK